MRGRLPVFTPPHSPPLLLLSCRGHGGVTPQPGCVRSSPRLTLSCARCMLRPSIPTLLADDVSSDKSSLITISHNVLRFMMMHTQPLHLELMVGIKPSKIVSRIFLSYLLSKRRQKFVKKCNYCQNLSYTRVGYNNV